MVSIKLKIDDVNTSPIWGEDRWGHSKNTNMTFETNEQIEVLAEFKNGNLKPRKFRWKNRVYKIKQICGAYRHREGAFMTYNYSVIADSGNVYEITFHLKDSTWCLKRVHG